MPETYTRDGIDRTAQKLRENAAKNGNPHLTHEQARARVVQAVRRDESSR